MEIDLQSPNVCCRRVESRQGSRVARFSWYILPKREKYTKMTTKHTKWPYVCKIFEMAIKFTNIFRCKTLQNLPKLGFLVWKYTIWQSCEDPIFSLTRTCSRKNRMPSRNTIFDLQASTGISYTISMGTLSRGFAAYKESCNQGDKMIFWKKSLKM
jgi:hypothetical protein